MNMMAYNLSSFGSRFSLIFDPHNKREKHAALGMFLEHTSELLCGVKSSDGDSFLPFSDEVNNFQIVYMETSQNSLKYHAINKEHGYNMDVVFTSPFAPQNEKIMSAPFFYVDVKIKKCTRPHNLIRVKKNIDKGTFVFGIREPELNIANNKGIAEIGYSIDTHSRFVLGDFARTLTIDILDDDGKMIEKIDCKEYISSKDAICQNDGLFTADFDLSEKDEFNFSFVWSTYHVSNFIIDEKEKNKFLYEKYFENNEEVMNFAWNEKEEIMRKSNFYDSMFENSSLSQSWKDFIAFTFQSYKLNSLWAIAPSGKTSFSVWEGNCMYNSTMDVEYNDGLFYYTICPELLPNMLAQWASTEKGSGYIDHDLGRGYTVVRDQESYSHPMKIEENCNFTLMLYAYCKITGDFSIAKKHYDVLKKLAAFTIEADTTGNGIPNVGTANTIDDSIPAVQFAQEQTYLALKSASTLQVFSEIAEMMDDEEYRCLAKERSEKIIKTVNDQLWRDDHYGVCLDERQDGYKAFMTKEILSGPMQGRDEASIYAENGILYPSMCGFNLKNMDIDRMRENISNANDRCQTAYGCNHSENSDSIWISQNLWRDFSAAYLGIDLLDNVDRYWEFQKVMNTDGRLNLFIDTVGENALWYYPRGLTSIGVLYAMLRLKIDGVNKVIEINPMRNTMKIPLTFFADYEKCIVPYVTLKNGEIEIINSEMLKGYKIKIKK